MSKKKALDLAGLRNAYEQYEALDDETRATHGGVLVYQTFAEIWAEIETLIASPDTLGRAKSLINEAKQKIKAIMNRAGGKGRARAKDKHKEQVAPTGSWSEGRGCGRASSDEPPESPMGRRQADDGTTIGDGSGLFGGERLLGDEDEKESDPWR